MSYISKERLQQLCDTTADTPTLISAYIPMDRYDFSVNQTRFKNVMKSLRSRVANFETYRSFSELQSLQDDPVFWAKQQEGICFFLSPENFERCGLPFEPPMFHEVSNRFFTAPLILYRYAEEPFYVVALSPKKARLFDVTLFDISEREIKGLDQDIYERLRIDEIMETLQVHTAGRGGAVGSSYARFHGQGSGSEKLRSTLLSKYVRSISKELKEHLVDSKRRIIFAGAPHLFSLFRELSGFNGRLVLQSIEGSFDHVSLSELHKKVQIYIKELLAEEVRAVDATFDARRGAMLSEVRDSQIVHAAKCGEVDSLIVNVDKFVRNFKAPSSNFGRYESAIRETWLHGGKVIPAFDIRTLPMKAMKRFSAQAF